MGRRLGAHQFSVLPQACSMRASSGCQVPSPGSRRSVMLLREVGMGEVGQGVGGLGELMS